MTYPPSTVVTMAEAIAFREIEREAVLLNLETGTYFGLNAVATRVWALLTAGVTLGDACATLEREFDVDAATLSRDVNAWLHQLIEKGLVRTR